MFCILTVNVYLELFFAPRSDPEMSHVPDSLYDRLIEIRLDNYSIAYYTGIIASIVSLYISI